VEPIREPCTVRLINVVRSCPVTPGLAGECFLCYKTNRLTKLPPKFVLSALALSVFGEMLRAPFLSGRTSHGVVPPICFWVL
jgi:hypothetical protein